MPTQSCFQRTKGILILAMHRYIGHRAQCGHNMSVCRQSVSIVICFDEYGCGCWLRHVSMTAQRMANGTLGATSPVSVSQRVQRQ